MTLGLMILACASCYGDPSAAATRGMNMGILFMLGVTALVLSGCGIGIIALARRARRLEQSAPPLESVLKETQT